MTIRRALAAAFCLLALALPAAARQGQPAPPPAGQDTPPPDPLPRYTDLVKRANHRLSDQDAGRLAGWILNDAAQSRFDPALLLAVMAADGTLQAARTVNGTLAIGNGPAERFVQFLARDLARNLTLSAPGGPATPAAIHSALVARAAAVAGGRRGRDAGGEAYAARVLQLYRQVTAQLAASTPAPAR